MCFVTRSCINLTNYAIKLIIQSLLFYNQILSYSFLKTIDVCIVFIYHLIEIGWRAIFSPSDHPVSQYEFDDK